MQTRSLIALALAGTLAVVGLVAIISAPPSASSEAAASTQLSIFDALNPFASSSSDSSSPKPGAVKGTTDTDYASYATLSASEKLDALWSAITADAGAADIFMPALSALKYVGVMGIGANMKYLQEMSYYNPSTADWRSKDHQKVTHGQGGHAKAHFEWTSNHPYTGMFKKADHCIIRMANAAEPQVDDKANNPYGPNMAIKCLTDGEESANIQLIWQLDGYGRLPKGKTDSCSFFEAPLMNVCDYTKDIPGKLANTFEPAFLEVDPNGCVLGNVQFADKTQDGAPVSDPEIPFGLIFKPRAELNGIPCAYEQFMHQLLGVESTLKELGDMTLFDIFAVHDPCTEAQLRAGTCSPTKIGSLKLDAGFEPSRFGNHQLFFRHSWFKDQVATMSQSNPERSKEWSDYMKANVHSTVSAQLYLPYLQ